MPAATDLPAVGKVLTSDANSLVFQPLGTTYELHLATAQRFDGPAGQRTHALIHAAARKVLTVPSGGNFIVPIAGPPRIVQGRIKHVDQTHMVVQAGAPVIVELPKDEDAYSLTCGPLRVGTLVNVTILPGARIELLADAVVR